jgi:hypothetical protein
MSTDLESVDAVRIEIDRMVEANAVKLRGCPPAAPIIYRQGAISWVQTPKSSSARDALLREQRELFVKRNAVYARWAELRVNEAR